MTAFFIPGSTDAGSDPEEMCGDPENRSCRQWRLRAAGPHLQIVVPTRGALTSRRRWDSRIPLTGTRYLPSSTLGDIRRT